MISKKINFSLKTTLAALAISLGCLNLCLEGVSIIQFANNGSLTINVACDDSGNAVAALQDNNGTSNPTIEASYFTGGTWSPLVLLNTILDPVFISLRNPTVAMDATGTALSLWTETPPSFATNDLYSAFFSSGVWTTPAPSPVDTHGFEESVAMNGLGQGLTLWANSFTPNMYTSFYSGGVWGAPVAIGTGNYGVNGKASYSSSGNASVVWTDYTLGFGLHTNIYANNFDGISWQGVQTLEVIAPTLFDLDPDAGIDALGNTLAVWVSYPSQDVVTSTYSGGSWSPLQTLSTSSGNQGQARIAVAPGGTAVAVWTDSANDIQMSTYDGAAWSGPFFVAAASQLPRVGIDANGNAVIGWVDLAYPYDLYFSHLPSGGNVVDSITLLFAPGDSTYPAFSFEVAISETNQTAFAVWSWTTGLGEGQSTWGTYYAFVPPTPTGFIAQICTNRNTNQYDCSINLSWDPSADPDVVSYNLYKNNDFLANVLATDPLFYTDTGVPCSQINTYSIEAVNSNGVTSPQASVTVNICSSSPCG